VPGAGVFGPARAVSALPFGGLGSALLVGLHAPHHRTLTHRDVTAELFRAPLPSR
jgi:hypothetical protein